MDYLPVKLGMLLSGPHGRDTRGGLVESPPATMVDLLRRHASEIGDRVAMTYLDRGEQAVDEESFASLDAAARAVAGYLSEAGLVRKPVVLAIAPGLDFVRCFLGCLYAGALAVPVPALSQRRGRARVAAIVADVRPAAILTSGLTAADTEWIRTVGSVSDPPVLRIDVGDALAARPIDVVVAPRADAPAYIQYTSGSTSRPKGIVITHRNIMANLAMIKSAFGEDENGIGVSWLPHHNDMGLIGCILQPLYLGARTILMSPLAFLQQPVRWLRAIDRYRATTSGAPDFAYDLCTRHIQQDQIQGLDLSCWQVAFCGSEPVRLETMTRFADKFRPYGFRDRAIYPCYGLAEATLLVTGGSPGRGICYRLFPRQGGSPRQVVSCGRPWLGGHCAILDPERPSPVPPGAVGEICVSGEHVSPGTWSSDRGGIVPDVERLVQLDCRTYLRTGDLGVVVDDKLFVVGRLKDIIVSRGVNVCAEDVEETITGLPGDPSITSAAAFSIDNEGHESLVIVAEAAHGQTRSADVDARLAALRSTVAETHGIAPADVAIVPPKTIQRTSNGKIQRSSTREQYLRGQLKIIASLRGAPSSGFELDGSSV